SRRRHTRSTRDWSSDVCSSDLPAELKASLAEHRPLRRWFDQLNYSTRKEIADWIAQVKSSESRVRRAQQIAERLLATMEAEREQIGRASCREGAALARSVDGSA